MDAHITAERLDGGRVLVTVERRRRVVLNLAGDEAARLAAALGAVLPPVTIRRGPHDVITKGGRAAHDI